MPQRDYRVDFGCPMRWKATSRQARQLRDPAIFEENGKTYLFYSICGEQGIAAARIDFEDRP